MLAGEGVGSWIHECRLVDHFVGVGILVFDVEILGGAQSVVSEDEVFYHIGQIVLLGQFLPVEHMVDDDAGTLFLRDVVVGVHAGLVLGEEHGVVYLADVVVEGSGPDE